MKKSLLATLAVLALAFAAPMSAADENELTVTGTVVSSTTDSVVVRTPEGEKTFVISMLTDEPDSLAANSQVTIRYHEEDGRLIAKEITLAEATTDTSATVSTDTSATATTDPSTTVTTPPTSGTGSDDLVGDVGADTAASSANEPSDTTATTDTSTSYTESRTDVDITNVEGESELDDDSMTADQATDTEAAALPATATKLPLLALIGLVLMAAGLAIRIAR